MHPQHREIPELCLSLHVLSDRNDCYGILVFIIASVSS